VTALVTALVIAAWLSMTLLFMLAVSTKLVEIQTRLDAVEKAERELAMLARAVDRSLCDHLREHAAPIMRRGESES
jgi:hypothetical protein